MGASGFRAGARCSVSGVYPGEARPYGGGAPARYGWASCAGGADSASDCARPSWSGACKGRCGTAASSPRSSVASTCRLKGGSWPFRSATRCTCRFRPSSSRTSPCSCSFWTLSGTAWASRFGGCWGSSRSTTRCRASASRSSASGAAGRSAHRSGLCVVVGRCSFGVHRSLCPLSRPSSRSGGTVSSRTSRKSVMMSGTLLPS